MTRAAFLLALALVVAPLDAQAQERGRPAIGFLTSTQLTGAMRDAFVMGLRDHGYVEGKNIEVLWRSADGKADLAKRFADELAERRIRLLVTVLTPAAQAAKNATRDIPIVLAYAGDPVATGLVSSLARPGGNITGISANSAETGGKRIELLREAIPGIKGLGLLILGSDPFARPFVDEMEPAARQLGMQLHVADVRSPEQIDAAFGDLRKRGAQAVIVQGALTSPSWRVAELALRHKLPAMSPQRRFAEDGGMMSHGANLLASVRRSAFYVDRILRGARPGDMAIEQPTRFELVINARTARALGVALPPSLLGRADRVIE